MKHFASPDYWESYRSLPSNVRQLADKQFALLKQDPGHPSLRLKQVGQFWSVRVGRRYRALGFETEDGIVWFWIGSHSEYDRLVNR